MGFIIPIPQDWWARDEGCSLVTAYPEYTVRDHRPVQLFFDSPIPPAADARWQAGVVQRLKQRGIDAYKVSESGVGGNPATCIEFRTPNSVDRSNIVCDVHRQMTIVFYYYDDDQKMKAEFYQILASIRPVETSR